MYRDGAIFYMNGNDGTEFDWDMNERTCEFMQFYEETELGVAKVYVTDDGYMCGWIFLDAGKGEAIELEPKYVGEVNAVCLYATQKRR